ncbi:MAG: lysophospholipid acyltransferase family protein [Patescibacteria group bacterium]|nr:lysophospholipid acyltransferase family protein [Patescibacteria group bacterium]MDD5715579.1 lysophospholipid acyltransferase family protein [Patescibacteria group bacterium]
MMYRLLRKILGPLIALKLGTVTGAENLPSAAPFIVAANHVGFLDGPALSYILIRRFRKAISVPSRYILWVVLGGAISRSWFGAIPINPKRKRDTLDEATAIISRGGIVLMFPEATRNIDPSSLLKGKTGAIRLALATGAPLIPAGLVNPTGHSFLTVLANLFRPSRRIDVRFGPSVDLAEFRGKPIDKSLLDAATRKLMSAVGQLCGKSYSH